MAEFHAFSRSNPHQQEHWDGRHRFEHWYRDNQVYLITARTRNGAHAFLRPEARDIFWAKFDQYTRQHLFAPWVTTLLSNHYHTVGLLLVGTELKELMRKLHGSVAKLVNDTLEVRLTPFWGDGPNRDYFDGCLRDETQLRRSYRYVLLQSERHKLCRDHREYRDTRVELDLESAVSFAREHEALMYGVPYARYERHRELQARRSRRSGLGT